MAALRGRPGLADGRGARAGRGSRTAGARGRPGLADGRGSRTAGARGVSASLPLIQSILFIIANIG
ncbi:hypothetical protein AMQ84_02985 [Paenibacillus riograndensis]|uniref:Uncharacterized protein n=1 Tax=Paenibacillus riograndensis TaxID=483937 RepID=A0A132UB54_9BACL|nr:hypothetical protein AMQ84_02985 [Paenibacillus riograndensis]